MEEIWKPIICEGFEGLYEVSNLGNVKSLERTVLRTNGKKQLVKECLLNKRKDRDGYEKVYLSNMGVYKNIAVHRLVAMAFIPNSNNLPEVNHINSIRDDNKVENLEWVTSKQNSEHAYKYGYGQRGLEHNNSKQVVLKKQNGEILSIFESVSKCNEIVAVNKRIVAEYISNKTLLFDELIIEYANLTVVDNAILNINPFKRLLPQVNSKPVVITDLYDNTIAIYPSLLEAERVNDLTKTLLHKYKSNNKLYKGKYYIKDTTKLTYMMSDEKYINKKIY